MRNDPSHCLTEDLCLVVVSLDGDKHLPKGLGLNHVVKKLDCEPPTERDHFHGRPRVLGEGGVEETEAETILQVTDGVNEGGIAFLDDVVEAIKGH